MPFMAAGALLGGLAGAGTLGATAATLAGGSALAGAVAGGSLGSMFQGAVDSKKAQSTAGAAAQSAQIDINALDQKTREIAKQNALDAAALEKQLTPEVPQLRTAANNAVLNGIGGNPNQATAANFLMSRFGQPVTGTANFSELSTPMLNEAIAKARADLGLGGKLSNDQRAESFRRGSALAGEVGGGNNLGLGRDLVARDLGLTSYNIEQQRLQNALNAGNLELGREGMTLSRDSAIANANLGRDSLNSSNFLSQYGLLNSYYNNLRSQDLAAAAYGQSIPQPVVGLDPSAVANLTIANQNNTTQALMNQANIKAQGGNNLLNFGGQLLGYGMANGFGTNSGTGGNTYTPGMFSSGMTNAGIRASIFGPYG